MKPSCSTRKGAGDLLGRKEIGEQRIGSRRMGRSARAQEHAAAHELAECLRHAAQRHDRRGGQHAAGQHQPARIDIRQPRQRNAHHHEEDHAGWAAQEPQRFIGQREILLDPLRQHAEHGLVEKLRNVASDDGKQRKPGRCGRGPAPFGAPSSALLEDTSGAPVIADAAPAILSPLPASRFDAEPFSSGALLVLHTISRW
jgi:hypothetical protein